jgi:hypothetical protein
MNNGNDVELAPSMSHSQFLRIALGVLAVRWVRMLALLMSFVLFGAATWWPERWRLAAAVGFTVLAMIPVWFKREGGSKS